MMYIHTQRAGRGIQFDHLRGKMGPHTCESARTFGRNRERERESRCAQGMGCSFSISSENNGLVRCECVCVCGVEQRGMLDFEVD